MRREVNLEDISDGNLYDCNDLVRAGCYDCQGCHQCCRGMGKSLVLDPYDICRITNGLEVSFMELLNGKVQLNVVDGVILPNMDMEGGNEACSFLDENGRCSIHSFRPGICRLFPLGRYYENSSFKYFLQAGQCKKENKTKVKIKKFLQIENIKEYEDYITDWHYFLNRMTKAIEELMKNGEDGQVKSMTMNLLNTFFIEPYNVDSFFAEYYERRKRFDEIQ